MNNMELKRLESLIGKDALNQLKKDKSVLKISKSAVPSNVWIENSKGKMLWHSCSEKWIIPNMSLFTEISRSKNLINYPKRIKKLNLFRDQGEPCSKMFALNE